MDISRLWFPHVVCKDGAKLSIQASNSHYCIPRNDTGPYTHIEVGYPSVAPPDTWIEYADNPSAGVNSDVFGYIPVELVQEYIDAHGGVDIIATLNNWKKER